MACVLPRQMAQSFLNQALLVYTAEHWWFHASMVFFFFLINHITVLQKLGMENFAKSLGHFCYFSSEAIHVFFHVKMT